VKSRETCKQAPGAFRPVVDHARCEGKKECVAVCPFDVFEVRCIDDADWRPLGVLAKLKVFAHGKKTAYAPRADTCEACGLCVKACPEDAIKLVRAS
jgi:4Fe-4S ferredoxin